MFHLVEVTSDLFFQPLQWNMWLSYLSGVKLLGCNMYGLWGLLFGDEGLLWESYLGTWLIGAKATYLEWMMSSWGHRKSRSNDTLPEMDTSHTYHLKVFMDAEDDGECNCSRSWLMTSTIDQL